MNAATQEILSWNGAGLAIMIFWNLNTRAYRTSWDAMVGVVWSTQNGDPAWFPSGHFAGNETVTVSETRNTDWTPSSSSDVLICRAAAGAPRAGGSARLRCGLMTPSTRGDCSNRAQRQRRVLSTPRITARRGRSGCMFVAECQRRAVGHVMARDRTAVVEGSTAPTPVSFTIWSSVMGRAAAALATPCSMRRSNGCASRACRASCSEPQPKTIAPGGCSRGAASGQR